MGIGSRTLRHEKKMKSHVAPTTNPRPQLPIPNTRTSIVTQPNPKELCIQIKSLETSLETHNRIIAALSDQVGSLQDEISTLRSILAARDNELIEARDKVNMEKLEAIAKAQLEHSSIIKLKNDEISELRRSKLRDQKAVNDVSVCLFQGMI